ncbi:hypothetical protein Maq22A_1p37005 (plasmid) [Methylobacterium aquaticum]|uniref:Uncharacterized protein n=1 Tax=Methylobacterium aquaticum TaxID=270351 RepID=A0A0C6FVI4_9HYPH|nr:hypothetical protein Maq22A_1p37005 [Methylobacterium aquaticum]
MHMVVLLVTWIAAYLAAGTFYVLRGRGAEGTRSRWGEVIALLVSPHPDDVTVTSLTTTSYGDVALHGGPAAASSRSW